MTKRVDRVRELSAESFRERYLFAHTPVIIEDLIAGQPLADVRTAQSVVERFGEVRGRINPDPMLELLARTRSQLVREQTPAEATLAEFVEKKLGGSMYVPAELFLEMASELPAIVDRPREFVAYFANGGYCTHLHFDEHMYHNVLYHVFGTKRVFLFPESSSSLLAPMGYWSRIFIEHMTEEEKVRFVDWAGGYDCTLKSGDGLFIPAGMWHHAEYVDTAMSLSCRFGVSNHIRSLTEAIGYYHGTAEFLHIASGMVDDAAVSAPYKAAYREVEALCAERHADKSARFRAIQTLLERLCAEICPEKNRLITLDAELQDEIERFAFQKGDRVDELRDDVARAIAVGATSEALGLGERFLSLRPDDVDMLATLRKIRENHPEMQPLGPPRITMLGARNGPESC